MVNSFPYGIEQVEHIKGYFAIGVEVLASICATWGRMAMHEIASFGIQVTNETYGGEGRPVLAPFKGKKPPLDIFPRCLAGEKARCARV